MHESAFNYVSSFAENIVSEASLVILEFGSRNVNGTVRDLFPDHAYWGIDISDGPGVDQVADAATFLLPEGFFADIVICCETLEHTPLAFEIVSNAYKNLSPGGFFVVTCATDPRKPHSAKDGGRLRRREYYGNILPQALKGSAILAGFNIEDLQIRDLPGHGGDLYMTAYKPLNTSST